MNNTKISDIINFSRNNSRPPNKLSGDHIFYLNLVKEYLTNYIYIHNKKLKIFPLLDNDDILTDLTTAMMLADLYFNSTKSSQKYWRIKCMLWQLGNINLRNKHSMFNTQKDIVYNKTPEDELIQLELHNEILDSIDSIGKREASILNDYYFNNLTQSKIAKKHGISQPRINEILAQNKKYLQEDLIAFCP